MKTTSIIRNTKLPNFIRNHKIFEKAEEIHKIFPKLGLTNCSVRADSIDYTEEAAKAFRTTLSDIFLRRERRYAYVHSPAGLSRVASFIRSCKPEDFIIQNKLNIPTQIQKRYGDINFTYRNFYYGPFNGIRARNIYKLNVIGKDTHVVFSSKDTRGAWDIATMSMRGISSCQGWRGCYKRNLVGSIVDPFVGILYLTDNTQTKYGTRMLRRALVRYVVHKETNKPALMLERIYPVRRDYPVAEPEVMGLFIQFLKDKTGGKLPIITSESAPKYSIPNSKIVSILPSCGVFEDGRDYCKSYRDSSIAYAKTRHTRIKNIKPF